MSEPTAKSIKERFEAYDKAKAEFTKTHKPAVCSNCHIEINPGDDIYVSPFDETIFCCMECGLDYHGISNLIFNEDDEDYYSWFDKNEQ